MQLQGKAIRVIIYFGESDHYEGKALHAALLEFLKREGAAGATVVRGLSGFGAHSRIHTAKIVDISFDLPLRLEWVDQPETVERLLPQVRRMVDDGLITVEEVDVAQYAPGRRPDLLAQPVQDVMRTEVVTVSPDTPAAELVRLLLQKGYRSLPVVDNQKCLLGIITDGDLLNRAGLSTRLDYQTELSGAVVQQQLSALRARNINAEELMTTPVISIPATSPLRDAVEQMVGNNLKRLPVVDAKGCLAGWISRVDVLRTLEYHQLALETETESPVYGRTIADMMYRDVPAVHPWANLEEILQALERNRRRRAVVVDSDRHVLGIITDGDLLRRTQKEAHPGLRERLRALVSRQSATSSSSLLDAKETAEDLMTTPVITVSIHDTPAEALRLMVQHQVKRLPVVDEDGRLAGLLGRASLLRGLMDAKGNGESKPNDESTEG